MSTDYAPVGIVDDRDVLFTTLRSGDTAATMTAVDTGPLTGGRWFIDAQSHPGLFSVAYNPAVDTSARLVVADAAQLPTAGLTASVTVHYYDRYQIDANGNPLPGRGWAETLVYSVEPGMTRDLATFGSDLNLGAATHSASPSLASLLDGGFVAVWQAPDAEGGALRAQVRDASGSPRGASFALTSGADGALEADPAVAALDGGRFVTAYTVNANGQARIAYRVVDAAGNGGAQQYADLGSAGDTGSADVVALQNGGFAIAWRAGGQVHVRQSDAYGKLGADQVYGTLGTAFSPSLSAKGGSYAVSWGEIGDGNVYAALAGGPAFVASGDGLAASITTAAPLPGLTVLKDGSFVVAWDSYANTPLGFSISDIFFQRFDAAGNRLGQPVQANVDSGGGRFDVSVTATSDGGFAVAWQSQTGDFDGNGVFGRRFGADGGAIDAREFSINEMRAGDQASVSLTALANGGLAAAWVDTGNAGAAQVEARVLGGGAEPLLSGTSAQAYGSSTEAPNLLRASAGSEKIDGLGGVDTVSFAGVKTAFSVTPAATGVTVTDKAGNGGVDTLVNVERLAFSDVAVALDIKGNAGQAYRLYTAAFDRAPDKGGLGYWIKMMDSGMSLQQVAAGFTTSKEFADLYGANSSNAEFVGHLYDNVLHRPAEGAGRDFWLDSLSQGVGREVVLAHFSESAENQAQVIGVIQNGIEYTPWG